MQLNAETITTALKTLFEPSDVFEVRVLDAVLPNSNWQHVESGYFDYDHIDVVPNALANFKSYAGMYVTLNPVNPDLLARAANRLKPAKRGDTTSDGDILRRRWMLVDVDPVRPAGISATDSEKSAAFDLAMECADGLASMGLPKPMIVDSGNGTQLLYRIDLPTDDGGLIQQCLQALQPVSTDSAHIDVSVHNPARICRLPGTWNRKGDHIETRPHRISEIFEIPEKISVVSEELLNSLAGTSNNESVVADNSDNSDFSDLTSNIVADDYNQQADIRPLLEKHGWKLKNESDQQYWWRPGKADDQHSATYNGEVFYPFSDNAEPFEQNKGYSRFGVFAALEHGGDFSAATSALLDMGYGPQIDEMAISGIVGMPVKPNDSPSHNLNLFENNSHNCQISADNSNNESEIADPGPIPEHMFDIPGLIQQVMDFTLTNAPYPNVGLAFSGALALQSYLSGRKVRTPGDLRPNIYLLALASSGTGKDFPRKVNSRVLFEIGHVSALGDKFASGEGIQDALLRSNAMLFQNDEMDGVLRQINFDKENKRESIPTILLTLYTSANDVYPVRVKASQKDAQHIDQPHLTLFGTATPQYFYESLSQRMLTNGLFARMMIIDIGTRGHGQTPGSPRDIPEPILNIARWWSEFSPGRRGAGGNLYAIHPEPLAVPFEADATEAIESLQQKTDSNWRIADTRNDEVARTAWSRTCENAKKLALLYACSENHENPMITLYAVEWASKFALHQTQRQLFLAQSYVAENPFHSECLKLIRKLRNAPGKQMQRQHLLRAMRCKSGDFDQLVSTLMQQNEIEPVEIPSKTKSAMGYKLI